MKEALKVLTFSVSRHKARQLMREAGVYVRSRKTYKVTTNSNHKQPVFDNVLNRPFKVAQADQVYAADMTYLWAQEGWIDRPFRPGVTICPSSVLSITKTAQLYWQYEW